MKKKINDHYDVKKTSLIFMSVWKLSGKKVKTAQMEIAVSQGLIGIFACMQYDPWNNAFKAIMKKQKYKTLSFDL